MLPQPFSSKPLLSITCIKKSNSFDFRLFNCRVLNFQLFPAQADEVHSAAVVLGEPMQFAEQGCTMLALVS